MEILDLGPLDGPPQQEELDLGPANSFGAATTLPPEVYQTPGGVGRFRTAVGGFARGFGQVLEALPRSASIVANWLTDAGRLVTDPFLGDRAQDIFFGADRPVEEGLGYQLAESIRSGIEDLFPQNSVYQDEWLSSKLPTMMGSLVGYVGAALLTRGVGMGASAGAATTRGSSLLSAGSLSTMALGSLDIASSEFRNAYESSGDEDLAFNTFLLNLPGGALEAIGPGRALRRFNTATGGAVTRVLREGAITGFDELWTEVAQQAFTNLAAGATYDTARNIVDGIGDSALGGGVTGAILGATLGALGGRRARAVSRDEAAEVSAAADLLTPTVTVDVQERADFTQSIEQQTVEGFTGDSFEVFDVTFTARFGNEEVGILRGSLIPGQNLTLEVYSADHAQNPLLYRELVSRAVEFAKSEGVAISSPPLLIADQAAVYEDLRQNGFEVQRAGDLTFVEKRTGGYWHSPSKQSAYMLVDGPRPGIYERTVEQAAGPVEQPILPVAPDDSVTPDQPALVLPIDQHKRGIRTRLARWLLSRGNFPEKIFEAKEKIPGRVGKEIYRFQSNVAALQNIWDEQFNGNVPPEHMKEVAAYIRGESDGSNLLPEEAKAIEQMRLHVDTLTRIAIKEGVATGEMALRFEENIGFYLLRSYKKFDRNSKWPENIPDEVRSRAEARARADLAEILGAPPSDVAVQNFLNDLLATSEGSIGYVGGRVTGALDLSSLQERLDIPEEYRAFMGEVSDPVLNYARTVENLAGLVANAKFLNEVKNVGMGVWFWEKGDYEGRPPNATAEIAGSGSKALGPLAGLVTTPEIADAFHESARDITSGPIVRQWMRVVGTAKFANTVASPAAWMRDIIGSVMFPLANGHMLRRKHMGPAWEAVKDSMRGYGKTPESQARLERLTELHILDQSVKAGEFGDVIEDATVREGTQGEQRGPIARLAKKMSYGYQAKDNFYRVLMFESEVARRKKAYGIREKRVVEKTPPVRDEDVRMYSVDGQMFSSDIQWAYNEAATSGKEISYVDIPRTDQLFSLQSELSEVGKSVHTTGPIRDFVGLEEPKPLVEQAYVEEGTTGKSVEEIEAESARIINNGYPTYSRVPQIIKLLRRAPLVGTYVSFHAEVFRTAFNTAALAKKEIADKNPGIRAIGYARMVGAMSTVGVPLAAQIGSAMALGITPGEEDDIRQLASRWERNSLMLFLKGESNGLARFVNLGHIDPYTAVKEPLYHLLFKDDETGALQALGEGVAQSLVPFFSQDIVFKKVTEIMSNRTEHGREVYSETADLGMKAASVFAHFLDLFEPGVIEQPRRIGMAVAGTPNFRGKRYNPTEEISRIFGFRLTELDAKKALGFRAFEYRELRESARRDYARAHYGTTYQSVPDAYRMANAAYKEMSEEMTRSIHAAFRLGVIPEDIDAMLARARIGKEERERLWSGVIMPLDVITD